MRPKAILISALRGVRVLPGSLAVAFGLLTLAMAAGTVTFSVADAVAFRPLPYAAERLIGISLPADRPGRVAPVTPSDFFALEERAQAFTAVAASRPAAPVIFGEGNAATPLVTRAVTANLFNVLGVGAAAGRLFADDDQHPSGARPAVLGHAAWLQKFSGDRNVIGRTISFGADQLQIIGVLPEGVWHPMELNPPDVYVPYVATAADRANTRLRAMSVIARLRGDVTLSQARADVTRIVTTPVVVQPLNDQVVGTARAWLLLVLAAVALVIVIACVNVATLQLARATARAREFAIRASLGEPRRALIAGVLVESLVLSLAAGCAGIALSILGVDALTRVLPAGLLTRVSTIAVDGRVLAVSLGAAALSAAAFGAAPAWLATRFNLFSIMSAAGGPIIGGRRVDRSLGAFLVAEVAVVSLLLVAATLVVRSFIAITTADLGFERRNLATVSYMRTAAAPSDAVLRHEGTLMRNELLAAARLVPGVIDAAVAVNGPVPLAGGSVRYSIVVPGYGETLGEDLLEMRIVTPEYFGVMGMRLASGRLLNAGDAFGAPRAIAINEEAAKRFFPGKDAIGQVVNFHRPTTIVGVVRSVRFEGPEGDVRPEMYITAEQEPMPLQRHFGSVIVRTAGNARNVGAAVREAIRPVLGVDPGPVELVDDHFARLTAGRRFNAAVMATFGVIALAIGVVSIFATMQFVVTRQFREIGLRLALGASRERITRTVVGIAVRRTALGVVFGLMASWASSRALQSFVFGLTPTEPSVYLQVFTGLAIVAVAAALLPAVRAARLDPVEVLRRD